MRRSEQTKTGTAMPCPYGYRMWDLATACLDTAKLRGAKYADVRVMHLRQRDLTTKNGQVGTLAQSESIGLGVRVLASGGWGFASTDKLTREGVSACAAQAVSIAKASALRPTAERRLTVPITLVAKVSVGSA